MGAYIILESDRSRLRDLSELAVDDSTVDRTSGSCLVEESTGGGGFRCPENDSFLPFASGVVRSATTRPLAA